MILNVRLGFIEVYFKMYAVEMTEQTYKYEIMVTFVVIMQGHRRHRLHEEQKNGQSQLRKSWQTVDCSDH